MMRRAASLLAAALAVAGCATSTESAGPAASAAPVTAAPAATSANPGTTPKTTGTTASPTTTEAPTATVDLPVAAGLVPLPPQPDGVPFPTIAWPLGTLPDGVDVAAIDALADTAFGTTPDRGNRSLLIVIGGELVYERYRPSDTADTVMASYSVAKSFTSATIGLLAGDGLVDVAAPAPRTDWAAADDPRRDVTVEHLLHMASGLQWTEGIDEYVQFFAAPNAADFAAERPLVADPGTTFNYSTGTTAILADIAADSLGGPDQLDEYIAERLFQPLGITSATLMRDPSGTWYGGLGADCTPQDFARFGLLYLRDGVWDGQQVLPAGWVDYTRSPSPGAAGYGAQWWLNGETGSFAAQGLYGQVIQVVPDLDAVIVTTSYDGGDSFGLVTNVELRLREALQPA
jgi:CubicO group peptidase (beta-lactamase class C family)